MSTLTSDRSEAREAYQRVLGIVRHNTHNAAQGPLVSRRAILTVAGHADLEGDQAQKALRAAVENDDLLRVKRNDMVRFTLAEEDRLQAVIELAVAETPPDKSLVAKCNRLLGQCRD